MRNFKKVLALVLALSLVLSMGTVSFAAETSEADVLYDLGLFKGYSATEKLLGLADEADSEQAIVLIGRALGWEVDMAATVAFEDVSEWAVPYVAYAVANNITNGVSATEFGKMVDGKRMVTWVLRALGKGLAESWDNTDALAAEMGLTVPMSATTTRGVVAGVIYDLLDATPVGGSQTVIAALVAADPTLAPIAEAAGLIPAVTTISATMTGVKEVTVTFNKAVDDTAAVVKVKKGAAIYSSAVVWNETKTVATVATIIELPSGNYNVEVSGVEDETLVQEIAVAVEAATTVEVVSTTVDDEVASAEIEFLVKNQYGEDMEITEADIAASVYNVTQSAVVGILGFTTNDEFIEIDTTVVDAFEVADVVRVTVSYAGVTTQSNLVVQDLDYA